MADTKSGIDKLVELHGGTAFQIGALAVLGFGVYQAAQWKRRAIQDAENLATARRIRKDNLDRIKRMTGRDEDDYGRPVNPSGNK